MNNNNSMKSDNKSSSQNKDIKDNINMNNYKNLSTRAYLEMTVVPVVMTGMTELASEKPENPLEWLGNYILKHSQKKGQ